MLNKNFFHLLFLSISISTCFASKDPTKISNAEQIYYSNDREWNYLEKILVKNLNKVNSKTNTVINYITTGVLIIPTGLLINYSKKNTSYTEDFLSAATCSVAFGSLCAYITKKLGNKILNKKIYDEKLTNVLEMFLQKYNPITDNTNNDIKYKNIVPEELHQTFDSLYEGYKSLGKIFLKENGLEILYSIIDKIKYEKKDTKYKSIMKEQIANKQSINSRINTATLATAIISQRK